jgi:nucleotide-binding universal stress UspA family protein
MTIVCGTDFSSGASAAIAAAGALATRFQHEDVCLVHVLALSFDPGPVSMEAASAYAEQRLQLQAEHLRASLRGRVQVNVLQGQPSEALVRFAEHQRARALVVSSLGRAKSRLFTIGGTSERVALSAHVPVLVARTAEPFLAWMRGESPLRVLIGLDESLAAEAALEWVTALRTAGPCDVIIGYVYSPSIGPARYGLRHQYPLIGAHPDIERLLIRDLADRVGQLPGAGNVTFRAVHSFGRPGDQLLDLADAEAADLIVVGNHHKHGLRRIGSAASVALHFGHASVACVPAPDVATAPRRMPHVSRVLIPTDFSPASTAALAQGYGLAGHDSGEVCLLHVAPRGDDDVALASRLRALIPAGAAGADIATRVDVVRGDDVPQSICQAAERFGADVICMASHGSGLRRAVLGSVTERVMRNAQTPVLVVRSSP